MCNCEIIGVCGKVCEQPFEEKRQRKTKTIRNYFL